MTLTRFDRVQMVVADAAAVAAQWRALLDTEVESTDAVASLGARRTTLAVGTSQVELLEPDGAGAAQEFLRTRRGLGPFGVGFQTPDVAAVAARLRARGVAVARDGERIRVDGDALGLPALRMTIGPERNRSRVGLMQRLYEVTYLVADADAGAARFADVFGLAADVFCPIASENFGYRGTLTLLHPDALDRVEIIHPYDRAKTMGRFFERNGDSLYMCYGETDASEALRDRALEIAPEGFTGPREGPRPDNLFLYHTVLGGTMMGVSRTTFAWSWSGRPDRIAH